MRGGRVFQVRSRQVLGMVHVTPASLTAQLMEGPGPPLTLNVQPAGLCQIGGDSRLFDASTWKDGVATK